MNGVGKATFALQFSNGSTSFEKIKLGVLCSVWGQPWGEDRVMLEAHKERGAKTKENSVIYGREQKIEKCQPAFKYNESFYVSFLVIQNL